MESQDKQERAKIEDIRDMAGILERALNEALFHQGEGKQLRATLDETKAKLDEAQVRLDSARKKMTDLEAVVEERVQERNDLKAELQAMRDQTALPTGGNGSAMTVGA